LSLQHRVTATKSHIHTVINWKVVLI